MIPRAYLYTTTKSRWYPAEIIPDADYGDDLAHLENTPVEAESLLPSPEQTAERIHLYVNAEFMNFKQKGAASTLNGKHFKLVD